MGARKMTNKHIENAKRLNGFKGNESNKDLMFYLIGKLDDFDKKNDESHNKLWIQINKLGNTAVSNKTAIWYLKWIFGGMVLAVTFLMNHIFNGGS